MTENKRFKMVIADDEGNFYYLDKVTGEKIRSTMQLEDKLNELNDENARSKSEYKVLHTQFQDLKKFMENNLNEYWTREKLNEKIIKLSDENEQLKKEILHKKNKELKKEKKELCKYECKVKAFEEINELFKNGLIGEEHNDD